MINLATIIQEINQQIDGEALVRLFKYHADKIQLNGPTLKCFCPIHHELAFRSLIVNLKDKNYKCTMKHCAGFVGGSLVDLWAKFRDIEEIEAALDLVELLKLPIDLELVRGLSTNYAEKARGELQAGNVDQARLCIEQAIAFDPRNLTLKLFSALIWEAAGNSEEALAERLEVLDTRLGGEDVEESRRLLDTLMARNPPSRALLDRHVALARREGQRDGLKAALVAMADFLTESGEVKSAFAALEEAATLDPRDADLLERLARLQLELGRREEALALLARLADTHEAAGRTDQLLRVLQWRAELKPEDFATGERIAQALEVNGRPDDARDQWLRLARIHAEQGRATEAERILDKLLERDPRDTELMRQLAELFTRGGDRRRAIAVYRHMARLAQEAGEHDRVGDLFERARRVDPQDLGLRRDQAEWRLRSGDLDGGLGDLFGLADLYFEQGEKDAGMAVLARIASMAPGDLDKRLRIGRGLERIGMADEAYASYCQVVRDLMRQQQFEAALAVCEEVRRLRPNEMMTLDLRVDTQLALGRKSEAIEACREAAREALEGGRLPQAEAALLRGIKIERSELQARTDLARLYEKTGRLPQAAELWIETALIGRTRDDFAQACQSAREALRLAPGNREARVILAEGLEAQGQVSEALALWEALAEERLAGDSANHDAYEIYRHTLKLAPRKRPLLARVARLALRIDGPEAARADFTDWLSTFERQPGGAEELEAFRFAVETYPDELAWRTHLAALMVDAGEGEEAAGHQVLLLERLRAMGAGDEQQLPLLEQLTRLRPARLDWRHDLAEIMERQGRGREAASLFEEIGTQYLRQRQCDAALPVLLHALRLRPDLDAVLATVARLFEERGETAGAIGYYERLIDLRRRQTNAAPRIEVLEKLLALDPTRAPLRAELSDLYEMDGDLDRAVEQRFALARDAAAKNQNGEAISLCLRLRGVAPEFVAARELMVECRLREGQVAEAKEELDKLGDMALATGRLEAAENYFRRIETLDPADISAIERLGKLYEARQKLDEAAEAFGRVLELYERHGEAARATGVLRKLRRMRPGDLGLSLRLARALLAQGGDRPEAAEEWLGLIAAALERGQGELAEAALAEATEAFGHDWAWRVKALRLFADRVTREAGVSHWQALAADALAAQDGEAAREAAEEGLRLDPGNVRLCELRVEANIQLSDDEAAAAGLLALARLAAAQDDPGRAEAYLRHALKLEPRRAEALDELAEVLAATDRVDEACAIQRRLIEIMRHAGRLEQAVRRARRLAELRPGDEEARDTLAAMLHEAGERDEAAAIWRELAEGCATRGESEAAVARYTRMLDALPGQIDLLRRVADLTYETGGMLEAMGAYDRLIDALHAAGDLAGLEAEYHRILELEPGHLQLKERLADFLFEQGRKEDAQQLFLAIIAAYRDEREQHDEALRVLRHLKALDPEDLAVREEEALLLERAGRPSEAAQAWRQLAAAYRRIGDAPRCAGCVARAADLEGDSPELQVEAARLHGMLGERERSTAFYLRAIEINDRLERLEACVPILKEAIRQDPARLDLLDALANLYERLGRLPEALRQWLALGAAHEAASAGAAARQIYLHVQVLIPEEMESRRRLARLCEAEGDRSGALRELRDLAALAESEQNVEAQTEYLKRILALDASDESALVGLVEAWRSLGRLQELYETLSLLERLYCSTGREGEALAILDEMKRLKAGEPELMGRTIDLLIKTGQAAEAARQGMQLIQAYFDHGDDHHALETLRRIAEIDPGNIEQRIALARLVHGNRRESTALQEFFLTASKLMGETQWEKCLTVCDAALALFPGEMRLREMKGRVLGRMGRRAEAIEVQLQTASLYDERGDEGKARRVYETILDEQPDNQETLEAMVNWAMRHGQLNVAADHLLHLAESHYLAGRLGHAIEAMEKIREFDPSRLEVRARLAETYLEAGDEESAVVAWMETAKAMVAAGRNEPAIEIYERLLMLRPDAIEVMAALVPVLRAAGRTEAHERLAARLGELYLEHGRTGEALERFEELARRYPHDPTAWERLAGLYESQGRTLEAVDAYRRLYEIHRAQRRLEPARHCLEAALALAPADREMLEALGDLCLALSRRPEGIAWLARASQALHEAGEHARAADLARRILKLDPLNLDVRRLLAEAAEGLGERAAALEEYLVAARGYADIYQNTPAIDILCHVLELDPLRVEDRALYAKLLQREGRTQESVSQYMILLGMVDQSDDPRHAIKYCRQILAEQPEHPLAHVSLCEIYERTEKPRLAFKECEWLTDHHLAARNYAEAERFIRKGLAWFPEDLGMRTRLIDMLIGQNRRREAGEQLRDLAAMAEARSDARMTEWAMGKAREIEPDNLDHHIRLADYQERTGNAAGARQTRMGLVRLLLAGGRGGEARDLAARLVAAAEADRAMRLELADLFERAAMPDVAAVHLHQLARGSIAHGEHEEAKALARRALALVPRHTGAREALIEALRAKRELNEALAESEKLFATYDAAGELDGALRTLQATIDMVPSRPEPRRLLTQLYRKLKREDAMVEQLRRLAEIYVNTGEIVGAIESLRELLDARPDDTSARERYIDLYEQLGDEHALWDDYLQLARGCVRKGKLVEATRAYEKVITLTPEEPGCREEFVAFLFEQGQLHRGVEETGMLADLLERQRMDKEAGRVLDRALNYAPQEAELRLRLAAVYLRTGRRGLALETYRNLARQYEQTGDEKLLLDVIERVVEIDELNIEYRQRLAELLFKHGRAEEAFKQFGALARQYEERGLNDLAEHEYRRMLEIHPNDMEALTRMTEIHLKMGAKVEVIQELKRLAEQYAAQGQLKETVRIYRRILEEEPENTEMLNNYLDSYMQIGLEQDLVEDYLRLADLKVKKGELAEAIKVYQRVLEVEPGNANVRERLTQTQRIQRVSDDNSGRRAEAKDAGGAAVPAAKAPAESSVNYAETTLLPAAGSKPLDPALEKAICNYENILILNPNNPSIHAKLAETLDQAGRGERATTEWMLAADAYLAKGELTHGIELYERCIERRPQDTGLRERLSRARVQRDSLRAIDLALKG